MKSNNKQTNIIFSILGLIAVAAILSISLYFIKTAEYGNWVPTEGILINMQQTYNRGGNHHVGVGRGYILYYTYVVDGKIIKAWILFRGTYQGNILLAKRLKSGIILPIVHNQCIANPVPVYGLMFRLYLLFSFLCLFLVVALIARNILYGKYSRTEKWILYKNKLTIDKPKASLRRRFYSYFKKNSENSVRFSSI